MNDALCLAWSVESSSFLLLPSNEARTIDGWIHFFARNSS